MKRKLTVAIKTSCHLIIIHNSLTIVWLITPSSEKESEIEVQMCMKTDLVAHTTTTTKSACQRFIGKYVSSQYPLLFHYHQNTQHGDMIWIDSITQAAEAAARTHSHCLLTWMENPISADKQWVCVFAIAFAGRW